MGRGASRKRRSRELKERRRGGLQAPKKQSRISRAVTTAILSIELATSQVEANPQSPPKQIYETPPSSLVQFPQKYNSPSKPT